MALGYLGLDSLRCQARRAGAALARRIAGRWAAWRSPTTWRQSILCALIFYGFGLGLYGRVTGYQLYGVVLR